MEPYYTIACDLCGIRSEAHSGIAPKHCKCQYCGYAAFAEPCDKGISWSYYNSGLSMGEIAFIRSHEASDRK